MWTFVKHTANLLWNDELAFTRWARGFALWAGTVLAQVMTTPEDWTTWNGRQWALRLVPAAIVGIGGMITAGERNPKVQP